MPGRARAGQAEPVTPTLLRDWPLPGGGSGKDDRGSVLVIGGARKTPGAALLAGVAALRAGAGRLTLAVAESVAVQLAVALPEAGVLGLPETAAGTVVGSAAAAVPGRPSWKPPTPSWWGPGLDDKDETTALLRGLLKATRGAAAAVPSSWMPLPWPACRSSNDELGPWAGRLILTPNITEAGILLGHDVERPAPPDVPERGGEVRRVVSCQGVIARTRRSDAGRRRRRPGRRPLWEITTGHSGLGTSGCGDVLSGAIAGLRARGTHGRAGRLLGYASACERRRPACQPAGRSRLPRPGTHGGTAAADDGARLLTYRTRALSRSSRRVPAGRP